ncbi:hypothetical protein JCM19053_1643 [Vibrio sp. JCM 19053]|nr:hypothetical protein JCM19053_1643 [Vibrio sp. JCM 19053]
MAKVMLLVRIQTVSHMTRKGKVGALGEQTSNKLFKSDSQRAWHFHFALVYVFKVVCGGFGIALLTP